MAYCLNLVVTMALPPSSPIARLTVTGFARPVRFARLPLASNSKLPLRRGRIDASNLTPLIVPSKLNCPFPLLNEAAGMVVEKAPVPPVSWRLTISMGIARPLLPAQDR